MKKSRWNKILRILLIVLAVILFLLAVVPLIIPVRSGKDLVSQKQLAVSDSKFITIPFDGTEGIEFHYFDSESNSDTEETVYILLHGSLFNSFTWDGVLDFFDEKGRVVAYDQIPYGLSEKLIQDDWIGENPYTQDAAIQQLFSFLDALNINKVVLVGNSYGGTLAVKAALSDPERIEGLILVDAAVFVNEEMPAWLLDLPQVQHLGPLLARSLGSADGFFKQTYQDQTKLTAQRLDKTKINTNVINWDFSLWEYLYAWGSGTTDFTSLLKELDLPVLIVSGDGDTIVPVSDSERLNKEIANSDFILIYESGHVPHEETADKFIEEIEPWINEHFID